MIDVKIIKKPKSGRAAIGGGIATAGNSYTNDSQQTLADVLNFNAAVSRLLQPYDANNQPLAWAQATDPDGDGGIKAKTLRAAVTFASVGDIVAYQDGNLSGGTGGGGLDITALEDYLTTNGYATQAWVSAHFNDYVLTKAAVEAVLTGNITSHTHSQYLTEHQSLANYMTRGEIGDTYQAKSTALSFTAAEGYVAARFTNTALATSAAQNYIELWGTDGWFNLQAGNFLAHGAVTATSFVKTGGTASQFLKADGSIDTNSYLLSSAYTAADILTKIKTLDGAGSGLDADTLDGVQGKDYVYYPAYNFENGCLVRLKLLAGGTDMVIVHIRGNSYYDSDKPIDTLVQFYKYHSSSEAYMFIAPGALHNGYDFGNISVFGYDGHVYLWFKRAFTYQSFSVYAECTNNPHIGNLVEDITNATMPESGVSGLVTIVPKKSALITDNVASATKLQTARTINGTAFDGTAAITTAKWGTARNLTIGNTAKSVDGSGPVAWSLAEIGALGVNANAVSASKLQTARTIWGQSFDGTANVSGSLSGVGAISFNNDVKIAAETLRLSIYTKSGAAQGLAVGGLLASNTYTDWSKVPLYGIYSKGDIATDGTIKIGGGTITWDAGNNAFMFSHTVASQGDMVAFQNGNLSGGTGGGGLDIAALEDYLTTNGYATQDWVSAHFNDYVLTKAAVEAVLTGNITTHTHNQYLTEHQSLANYYTKAEADGKYLTAITKSMVEAVLTGNITSHTHSQYLTQHQSLANYVTLNTTQTISGAKTFSDTVVVQGGVRILYTNDRGYLQLGNTDHKQGEISAWQGVPLEKLILNAGKAEVRGAVTATSFVKTGGTATQFLKADGSVDSNSYLLSSAYTAADILTKIKTVDGAGSGLDADRLDGAQGKDYMYYNANNFSNGCLVRLKLLAGGSDMVTVHIKGNSYGAQRPIDTWVQFYNYFGLDIYFPAATHNGYDFGNINVFCYDGHVYLWFKQTDVYQSFSVYAECTNNPRIGNLVEDITNAAMPTEGVTLLVTIVPKKSALITDNVASATKLQTARTINGTAFDGTAAITTAKWGTARNITIGNTAKSVDGSGNVAWSLAEIGALAATANAVSASKLATPHTLWGQSFDGTDNVAGTLSGVEDIIFNVNARLNATDNAFRFFTKNGGAQGIQAGNLLISNSFSDANKVPENGIYSKDGLVTDGSIKIGGGTITWDEATNSFIFSHTVASQGDVVAFKQ